MMHATLGRSLAFAFAVLLAVGVSESRADAGQVPGQPVASPSGAKTAVIRGRIVAGDTGRPLRRAQITVTAPELGQQRRTANTGLDGTYEIKDLPPGRYVVNASRSGYLTLRYGQQRPLELARPLQLAGGQTLDAVDFSLPRMGRIVGRVLDDAGEPIAGVAVWAVRPAYVEGRRQLIIAQQKSTDDRGEYQLTDLVPGRYYVRAATRETWTVTTGTGAARSRTPMGFAPTFAPAAPAPDKARLVDVGVGQRVPNVDVALIPMRPAGLSGVAFDSKGQPLSGRSISLGVRFLREFQGGGGEGVATVTSGSDGSFVFRNIPSGEYELTAATGEIGTPGGERAVMQVAINGVDVEGVRLATTAGWTVAGRIVTEEGLTPVLPRASVTVAGSTLLQMAVRGVGTATVGDDWTFAVKNLVGPARLVITAPDGWMVKTIRQQDRDITSAYIELKSGEVLADVEVVLTSRVTRVEGQLVDDRGAPTGDATVVVFSQDREKWGASSVFVRAARPDQAGRYEIAGLPAGEYVALALDYVQEGQWNDPDYLESLRRSGQAFTLGEGGRLALALKVARP